MKLNAKDILKPALILFLICAVASAALAGTNLLTKDKIEEQNRIQAETARQTVLPNASSFEKIEPDGGFFDPAVTECFAGKNGDSVVGYVFTTTAKSYGGDIQVMTGISEEDGTVSGVALLSINDTPGLGMNAQKESFRDQYKQAVPANGFAVIKNAAPTEGEVEAMTGATITTNGVTDAVNKAVAQYNKMKGGDSNG